MRDVRYALRATDPTDYKTKATIQHGANRLAAIGLSAITVVPQRRHPGIAPSCGPRWEPRSRQWGVLLHLADLAGAGQSRRHPQLLGHPDLDDPDIRASLGIVELRRARRISFVRFMNFTRADSIS